MTDKEKIHTVGRSFLEMTEAGLREEAVCPDCIYSHKVNSFKWACMRKMVLGLESVDEMSAQHALDLIRKSDRSWCGEGYWIRKSTLQGCDTCKHELVHSEETPCCECSPAVEGFDSKWEKP